MLLIEGYVGVTSRDIKTRINEHKKSTNKHLENAFAKYNDIIIDELLNDSLENCLKYEENLRPEKNIGWNIAKGGGYPPKFEKGMHTEEFIDNIIERNKTLYSRPEQRERLSKLHKGKIISEDHKKIISETHKGKIISEETKLKMSNSMTGIERKKITCPHCGKTSIVCNIVRWHNDNCKFKNKGDK